MKKTSRGLYKPGSVVRNSTQIKRFEKSEVKGPAYNRETHYTAENNEKNEQNKRTKSWQGWSQQKICTSQQASAIGFVQRLASHST